LKAKGTAQKQNRPADQISKATTYKKLNGEKIMQEQKCCPSLGGCRCHGTTSHPPLAAPNKMSYCVVHFLRKKYSLIYDISFMAAPLLLTKIISCMLSH